MNGIPMRLMKDRRYEELPVERIVVLNSRDREEDRFLEHVKSIENVGLQKPILVNERFLGETGNYELVCGQGRLLAHRKLGKPTIQAEIIDCDRKEAYLTSLVENIARVRPDSIWFVREIKRLRDAGMSAPEISRIVGKSETHVEGSLRLVERGEERLLRGVENGTIPIAFALQVTETGEAGIQDLLMDAFDRGVVTAGNLRRVRSIIRARSEGLRARRESGPPEAGEREGEGGVERLEREIAHTVREKKTFIQETALKEGRLVSLVEALKALRKDEGLAGLLREEGLSEMPALQGPHTLDVNGEPSEEAIHHG